MTGSAHDGEATNAARLADRLVRSKGLMWGDVIPPALPPPGPPPDPWGDVLREWPQSWKRAVQLCQCSGVPLPGKSESFLRQISAYIRQPSEAQLVWLHGLVLKCRAA
jgi:hypothetical protein